MKKSVSVFALFLAFAGRLLSSTFLVEAEAFQFRADWEGEARYGQVFIVQNDNRNLIPATVVAVPESGKYAVWLSAFDHDEFRQGTRLVKAGVDGKILEGVAGNHGKKGFAWQKLGEVQLEKGEHLLTLHLHTEYGRADAIILTNEEVYDPNVAVKDNSVRRALRVNPVKKEQLHGFNFETPGGVETFEGARRVEIKNEKLALSFTEKRGADGKNRFVRGVKIFKGGKVLDLGDFDGESFYLMRAEKVKYLGDGYFPKWENPEAVSYILLNEKTKCALPTPSENPYAAAGSVPLRITDVEKLSEEVLKLTLEDGVIAHMRLLPDGAIRVRIVVKIKEDGYYSVAFKGFNGLRKEDMTAVFLPTFYQGTRVMQTPKMVEEKMTSHPLAMLSAKAMDLDYTNALIADPACLPFEWSQPSRSFYGFSIRSPEGLVQPVIFRPVLGSKDSFQKSGATLSVSWYILSLPQDWAGTFSFTSRNIFAGDTVREAYTASFSDAVANLAEYLGNAEASGWSAITKGRWNIEAQYTATQSSPLAEISIALLTDDENFYRNYSLPSIEFSLSRKTQHFAHKKQAEGSWANDSQRMLTIPGGGTSGDVWGAFNALLGGGNAWMSEFQFLPNGEIRTRGNPDWTSYLALYVAGKDPQHLKKAEESCRSWLAKGFDARPFEEFADLIFVNYGQYPYWWFLPELYEITKDETFLKYSRLGAYYTLSSLWVHPTPPQGDITIQKGNIVQGICGLFWKGGERYRLGYHENIAARNFALKTIKFPYPSELYVMPEKKVPAQKVSRIGLGIEQHWTYKWTGNFHNIINPSWAANMLRVSQFTQDDMLMKFSRHSIIGRYANFAGYYIKDFFDVQHDPDYPYKGPDMTNMYWHHAPVHFAQSMDYLMAQFEGASGGAIKFPHVWQQGYVWFVSRIFGQPGKVFDDALVRPILDKNAVRADSVKASTLMGRGKNSIWVMVLNDSANDAEYSLEFDPTARGFRGADTSAKVALYDASGKRLGQSFDFFGEKKVKIPAMKLVAFRVMAADYDPSITSAPIASPAHVVKKNAAKGLGDLHTFRIRGPFGKDSVYAVLTGGMETEGVSVKMTVKNGESVQTIVRDFYPFEFSVYPIPQDEDAVLDFEISGRDGVVKIENVKMGK